MTTTLCSSWRVGSKSRCDESCFINDAIQSYFVTTCLNTFLGNSQRDPGLKGTTENPGVVGDKLIGPAQTDCLLSRFLNGEFTIRISNESSSTGRAYSERCTFNTNAHNIQLDITWLMQYKYLLEKNVKSIVASTCILCTVESTTRGDP